MRDYVEALKQEFREGYQIPSYFPDSAVLNLLNESAEYFENLAESNIGTDPVALNLVKERAFYAYNHQLGEFASAYNSEITTWQMGKVGVVVG